MSLENIQLHFLWHLFRLYFINGSRKDAMSLVATMYDHPLDLPEKLESLLLNYWESGSDATLIEAAVTTAKKFYFDAERHVMLVAILVEMKTINIDEAASLLIFSGVNSDSFPESMRHVLDAAWLVNQDHEEGIMRPEQDLLLRRSLQEMLQVRKHGGAS
jgi:hypothetical protein